MAVGREYEACNAYGENAQESHRPYEHRRGRGQNRDDHQGAQHHPFVVHAQRNGRGAAQRKHVELPEVANQPDDRRGDHKPCRKQQFFIDAVETGEKAPLKYGKFARIYQHLHEVRQASEGYAEDHAYQHHKINIAAILSTEHVEKNTRRYADHQQQGSHETERALHGRQLCASHEVEHERLQ